MKLFLIIVAAWLVLVGGASGQATVEPSATDAPAVAETEGPATDAPAVAKTEGPATDAPAVAKTEGPATDAPAVAKTEDPATDAPTSAKTEGPAPYVIGATDVLQVTIWKEPEMSASSIPVRPDGKISLPLLGEVQASGLTPEQLGSFLAEQAKRFVKEPQVTVVVTAINSKRVFVIGEVLRPGPLSLLTEMTVLQALSNAGGLSQYAKSKKIYVLRTSNGTQNRIPFNYKLALKGDARQNIFLQPGDTIVVP